MQNATAKKPLQYISVANFFPLSGRPQEPDDGNNNKLVGGELFLKFEAAGEQTAQFVGGGLGFDLLLKSGEFFFDTAVAEHAQAALGIVPCGLGNRLE